MIVVTVNSGSSSVRLAARLGGCDPASVVIGVRPHELEARGEDGAGALEARVVLLEPAGAFTWVIAEAQGERLKARLAPGARLEPGSDAKLAFSADATHLFDAASGRRLER